jgi:hypothetical protein
MSKAHLYYTTLAQLKPAIDALPPARGAAAWFSLVNDIDPQAMFDIRNENIITIKFSDGSHAQFCDPAKLN